MSMIKPNLTTESPFKNNELRWAACFFVLLMSVVCIPVFAQTAPASFYDNEIMRLVKQRDSEIAKVVEPIQKRFEIAKQQILRKALLTGDLEAANKIKAMIDGAGEAAADNKISDDGKMVRVDGGNLAAFEIGKFEVTWEEWTKVRGWAESNGYKLNNPGQALGENHPVTQLLWYDLLKWCNAKSEMEGLEPVYLVNGNVYKTGQYGPKGTHVIKEKAGAKGYRLPSAPEWEWAARGGKKTKGYTYSGSNDLKEVGWFKGNSGELTHPVGEKQPNALGIYDMSGNVWEWLGVVQSSVLRFCGGSSSDAPGLCAVNYERSTHDPYTSSPNLGFRLARSLEK
jgi:hypothetical protein